MKFLVIQTSNIQDLSALTTAINCHYSTHVIFQYSNANYFPSKSVFYGQHFNSGLLEWETTCAWTCNGTCIQTHSVNVREIFYRRFRKSQLIHFLYIFKTVKSWSCHIYYESWCCSTHKLMKSCSLKYSISRLYSTFNSQ